MLRRVELCRVYDREFGIMWKKTVCLCVCVCVALFGEIKNTYDAVGLKEIDHLKDQGLDGLVVLKLFIKKGKSVKYTLVVLDRGQ